MHQLPIPPSEVRPTASFDSGNTQALVTRLQRFLESLEPRLHHPEPADVLPGEHPEHAYLAGHLMLLGFQLLLVRRESPESLRLLQDAAFTLTRFHLQAKDFTFTQAAYDISSFYGYLPTHAAHLTWNDLPHAIGMMHSTAQHAGLPFDPTWLPGGLAHRLIPSISTAVNPLCPPPLDLCPPRTACPVHILRQSGQ